MAALEAAASKRQRLEREAQEAEERQLREAAEKAREVPLPVEDDSESEDDEEEANVQAEEEEEVAQDESQGEVTVRTGRHEEAFAVESQESISDEVGMESEYLLESQGSESARDERTALTEERELKTTAPCPESKGEREELELGADDAAAARDQTLEVDSKGIHANEFDSEQDADLDEPESPIVDEIRLVGDLPPSPFLQKEQDASAEEAPVDQTKEDLEGGEEQERQDISTESVVTVAPSSTKADENPSADLPDASVALDTLALTCESVERSLLADTTLPRSPALEPAPARSSFSASTAAIGDEAEDFFPTPMRQAAFQHLAPMSPEPCQTASIVLETPPRFDDPPAQLRLPGRPVIALNFPGRAQSGTRSESTSPEMTPEQKSGAQDSEIHAREGDDDEADRVSSEEDDEDCSDVASPSRRQMSIPRRAIPPPTPLRSVPRQRQPVFFPETASYTDVETSFEEEQDATDGDDAEDELDGNRSYRIPLNDAEYDDSDLGEADKDDNALVGEPEEEDGDQGTPKAQSKVEGAATPQEAQARAIEEEDQEESRLELEQPELRFHDETESEPEMTIEESGEEEEEAASEEAEAEEPPPQVLKRSLRSRVVTVDLQPLSTKTPGKTRSREVLGEVQ